MTNIKLNLGLIFFLFVLFAGMTFAFDGTSCGVIGSSGTYVIQSSFSASLGDCEVIGEDFFGNNITACIVIGSDDVTLDCMGNTLDLNDVSLGIIASDVSNVTIKNCILENAKMGGIVYNNVTHSSIEDNTLNHNADDFHSSLIFECSGGISLTGSSNISVNNNILFNNSYGICLSRSGDQVSSSNNITKNEATFNRFTGIGLAGGSNTTLVSDNVFNDNAYGVIIAYSYNNIFRELEVKNNRYLDFAGDPVFYGKVFCMNDIQGESIDITGDKKLQVITTLGVTLTGDAETNLIIICADDVEIKDFTITGADVNNNGILVMADNLFVDNLDASGLMAGIYAQETENVTVVNSLFENNRNGILLNSIIKTNISNNNFIDNTANGITAITSPATFLFSGALELQPTQSQEMVIYDNYFENSGDGESISDVYPTVLGTLLDIGTGSGILLFLFENVEIYNNEIVDSANYGISTVLVKDGLIYDNEIDTLRGISGFKEDELLLFFELMIEMNPGLPPDQEAQMRLFAEQMFPLIEESVGTGILLDGVNTTVYGNEIHGTKNGLMTLLFSDLLIPLFFDEMPVPNHVYENEIYDSERGVVIVGSGLNGLNFHSNIVRDNDYGLAVTGPFNTIFNNLFNNTENVYLIPNQIVIEIPEEPDIVMDNNNTYNITITPEYNIIGGPNIGGNYWGTPTGTGYSDLCEGNSLGFCDPYSLNETEPQNNVDYLPLTLNFVPDCIDLNLINATNPEIIEEWGHVTLHKGTFFINDNTLICPNRYETSEVNEVYMYMNGSYRLDCYSSQFVSKSKTRNSIGIVNFNNNVEIRNCIFIDFDHGVVSTPNPIVGSSIGINKIFSTLLPQYELEIDLTEEEILENSFQSMLFSNRRRAVINDGYLYLTRNPPLGKLIVYSMEDFTEIYRITEVFGDSRIIPTNDGGVIYYEIEGNSLIKYNSESDEADWEYLIIDEHNLHGIQDVIINPETQNPIISYLEEDGDGKHYLFLKEVNVSDGTTIIWDEKLSVGEFGHSKMVFDENNFLFVDYVRDDVTLNSTTYRSISGEPFGFDIMDSFRSEFSGSHDCNLFSLGPDRLVRTRFVDEEQKLYIYNWTYSDFEYDEISIPVVMGRGYYLTHVGDYIYFVYPDYSTGSLGMRYIVLDLDLNEVGAGEFKPNYMPVMFNIIHSNDDDDNLWLLGEFSGNYNSGNYFSGNYFSDNYNTLNFMGYIDSEDDFSFNIIMPYDYEEDPEIYKRLLLSQDFVKFDSEGNTVVVGHKTYPRVSTLNIVKYDSDGTELLNSDFTINEETNIIPLDFIIDEGGNYLIGGYYFDGIKNEYEYFVVLINSNNGIAIFNVTFNSFGIRDDLFLAETQNYYEVFVRDTNVEHVRINKTSYDFSLETLDDVNEIIGIDHDYDNNRICVSYYNSDTIQYRLELFDDSFDTIWQNVVNEDILTWEYNDVFLTNDGCYFFFTTGDNQWIYFYDMDGNLLANKSWGRNTFDVLGKGTDNELYGFENNWGRYDICRIRRDGSEIYDGCRDIFSPPGLFDFSANGLAAISGRISIVGENVYTSQYQPTIVGDLLINFEGGWIPDEYAYYKSSLDYENLTGITPGNILIEMVEFGENKFIATEILYLEDDYTRQIISNSVNFWEVNSVDGSYSKLFNFSQNNLFPVKVLYKNNMIYVLMLEGEFSLDDNMYFPGDYVLYAFDTRGRVAWKVDTGISTYANSMIFEGTLSYDSGNLLVTGSTFGEFINVGEGLELPSSPTFNLVKVSASNGRIIFDREYDYLALDMEEMEEMEEMEGYMLNWMRGIHVTDQEYVMVGLGLFVYSDDGDMRMDPHLRIIKTDKGGNHPSYDILYNKFNVIECSEDVGWKEIYNNTEINVTVLSGDGEKIFAIIEGNLKVTEDLNNPSWVNINPPDVVVIEYIVSFDGGTIVVIPRKENDNILFISHDRGDTWSNTSDSLTFNTSMHSKPQVSLDGEIIMFFDKDGYIHRSEDGGTEWESMYVNDILLEPAESDRFSLKMSANGEVIYLYQYGKGIYVSTDGSDNWEMAYYISYDVMHLEEPTISDDGSTFILMLTDEDVIRTQNYGEDWDMLYVPMDLELRRITISGDSSKLLFATTDGLLLSEDVGNSWRLTGATLDYSLDEFSLREIYLSSDGEVQLASLVNHSSFNEHLLVSKEPEVCEYDLIDEMIISSSLQETNIGKLLYLVLSNGDTLGVNIDSLDSYGYAGMPFLKIKGDNEYIYLLSMQHDGSHTYIRLLRSSYGAPESTFALSIDSNIFVMDMLPSPNTLIWGGMSYTTMLERFSFKRAFKEELEDVKLFNVVTYNKEDGVTLVDLTSSKGTAERLMVGYDVRAGEILFGKFEEGNELDGYLKKGENIHLDPFFVSIDSSDANAKIFGTVPSTVRLRVPSGSNLYVVKADGFYNNRRDILRHGSRYETNLVFSQMEIGGEVIRFASFNVDGFSSYTLGSTGGPTGDDDMYVGYQDPVLCIGDEYNLTFKHRNSVGDLLSNVNVKIKLSTGNPANDLLVWNEANTLIETSTGADGIISFVPEVSGDYFFMAEKAGYNNVNDYFVISLIDCEEPIVELCKSCPEQGYGQNYGLVTGLPDCACECIIEYVPEGYTLVDTGLECYLEIDEEEEDEEEPVPENIIYVDVTSGDICAHEDLVTFTLSSDNRRCTQDVLLSIPTANVEKVIEDTSTSLIIELVGTHEVFVYRDGCSQEDISVFVNILDCTEEIEDIIEVPVEERFWDPLVDLLRTSIKGGCEGFYFEGIPTIFCDLVWVIVILGSIGAAYLEPIRNRKVISLVTPSVVSLILLPVVGAITAGVVVYLAYTSYKKEKGELESEKEQMESAIKDEPLDEEQF